MLIAAKTTQSKLKNQHFQSTPLKEEIMKFLFETGYKLVSGTYVDFKHPQFIKKFSHTQVRVKINDLGIMILLDPEAGVHLEKPSEGGMAESITPNAWRIDYNQMTGIPKIQIEQFERRADDELADNQYWLSLEQKGFILSEDKRKSMRTLDEIEAIKDHALRFGYRQTEIKFNISSKTIRKYLEENLQFYEVKNYPTLDEATFERWFQLYFQRFIKSDVNLEHMTDMQRKWFLELKAIETESEKRKTYHHFAISKLFQALADRKE